ncbi:DNA-processing protein DprA [Pedobacter insulae]|uniref:DNA processing protein n=1 Tax=Pedobacter insulae TaxID=414048 RepID=A0A1I2UL59_9SPHI|nr:DNA-processing protein DprA [Pedobacter insulae]SFG75501.1 DNA processing protein [Pedobacter insulae]
MSLVHKIALTLIKNIGSRQAKKLLLAFGDAESVFAAKKDMLLKIDGIGEKIASSILNTDALIKAEKEIAFIKKNKIEVLFYTDANYPNRLRNCYDAPVLLYFKGKANFNQKRVVSIVGTRNATPYGKALCKQLIETLMCYNVLVVSGLAYGIDVAAHKESLVAEIPTIGVLGHGLDRIYPPAHADVARKMIGNGGLLTEFLPGTMPDKENFPKRNRIIAGLCDVLVVVEASSKGGALITADIANSYARDVYAFPGRVNDEYSAGCNFLIKTNRAGLINHPRDLIYYLAWDEADKKVNVQAQLPLNLTAVEKFIVDSLKANVMDVDELSYRTNLSQSKLTMALLTLEIQGIITILPGKRYQLT